MKAAAHPLLAASLAQAVLRLEQVLEAENAALRGAGFHDWRASNARKQQASFELEVLLRRAVPPELAEDQSGRMQGLKELTQLNARLLADRIAGTREVCERLAAVIRRNEWDGTYGPRPHAGRVR